jgi:hypothetical protein
MLNAQFSMINVQGDGRSAEQRLKIERCPLQIKIDRVTLSVSGEMVNNH